MARLAAARRHPGRRSDECQHKRQFSVGRVRNCDGWRRVVGAQRTPGDAAPVLAPPKWLPRELDPEVRTITAVQRCGMHAGPKSIDLPESPPEGATCDRQQRRHQVGQGPAASGRSARRRDDQVGASVPARARRQVEAAGASCCPARAARPPIRAPQDRALPEESPRRGGGRGRGRHGDGRDRRLGGRPAAHRRQGARSRPERRSG